MSERKNRKKQTDNLVLPEESVEPLQTRQAFMRVAANLRPLVVESLFNQAWEKFEQLGELQVGSTNRGKSVLDLEVEKWISRYKEITSLDNPRLMADDGETLLVRDLTEFFDTIETTIPRDIFIEAKTRRHNLSMAIVWWCWRWNLSADWCRTFAYQVLLEYWKEKSGLPDLRRLSESEKRKECWEKAIDAMRESPLKKLSSPKNRSIKTELQKVLSKSLQIERVIPCLNEIMPILEKHYSWQKQELREKNGWKKQERVFTDIIYFVVCRRLRPLIEWEELVEIKILLMPETYPNPNRVGLITKRKIERSIKREVRTALDVLGFPRRPSLDKRSGKRQRLVND